MRKNDPVKVVTREDFAEQTEQERFNTSHALKNQTSGTQETLANNLIDKKYEKLLKFRDILEEDKINNDEYYTQEIIEAINNFIKKGEFDENNSSIELLKILEKNYNNISKEVLSLIIEHCVRDLNISIKPILDTIIGFQKWDLLDILLQNINNIDDLLEIYAYYEGTLREISEKDKSEIGNLLIDNSQYLFNKFKSLTISLFKKGKEKGIKAQEIFAKLGHNIESEDNPQK